jgi:hypothetical protein
MKALVGMLAGLVAVALGAGIVAPTDAMPVLCQRKSGVVVVRDPKCKKKEKALDLAQFGATGPKGDPGTQGPPGVGPLTTCPPDAVLVGTTCVDKYEASVWDIHGNATLLTKVKDGTVTPSDLTGGGATQVSPTLSCIPAFPASFDRTGNWTAPLYAASIPGVLPTACVSWFQANQACQLSGKRLLTNREWQGAAAGTPDPGNVDDGSTTCITNSGGPANTGSRANCKSAWGAFDMVGNVEEWVADWSDVANNCTDWTTQTGIAGADESCFGGAGTPSGLGSSANIPGASLRGGVYNNGAAAGVFAVRADFFTSSSSASDGFRCAR